MITKRNSDNKLGRRYSRMEVYLRSHKAPEDISMGRCAEIRSAKEASARGNVQTSWCVVHETRYKIGYIEDQLSIFLPEECNTPCV
jgi:hypothetical protein